MSYCSWANANLNKYVYTKKENFLFHSAVASWNGKFHFSPHENIFTIVIPHSNLFMINYANSVRAWSERPAARLACSKKRTTNVFRKKLLLL